MYMYIYVGHSYTDMYSHIIHSRSVMECALLYTLLMCNIHTWTIKYVQLVFYLNDDCNKLFTLLSFFWILSLFWLIFVIFLVHNGTNPYFFTCGIQNNLNSPYKINPQLKIETGTGRSPICDKKSRWYILAVLWYKIHIFGQFIAYIYLNVEVEPHKGRILFKRIGGERERFRF
jgi:hypothetical protein